jgi:uncharacterized membrane protein
METKASSRQIYLAIPAIVALYAALHLLGLYVSDAFFYLSLLPGFAVSFFIIGWLLLRALGIAPQRWYETVTYSLATSIFLLMATGLAVNTWLPLAGIDDPLASVHLLAMVIVLSLGLLLVCRWRKADLGYDIALPSPNSRVAVLFGTPPLLVILSVLGAVSLNNNGTNVLTMAMLGGVAVYSIALIRMREHLPASVFPWSLFFICLAVLLSSSLRGWLLSGHDILREFAVYELTRDNLQWGIQYYRDAYNSCLSITILPVEVRGLLPAIPEQHIFRIFFQVITALTPVAMYIFIRRYLSRTLTFLAVLFFISQPPFLYDFPFLTRQELATLFNVLILLALTRDEWTSRQRGVMALVFGASMVWSHYSTTYIAVGIFIIGLFYSGGRLKYLAGLVARLLRRFPLKRLYERLRLKPVDAPSGFTEGGVMAEQRRWFPGWRYALLLVVFTLGWNVWLTGTHNNLLSFTTTVFQNVSGKTSFSDYQTGLTDQFKIFSRSKNKDELLAEFMAEREGGDHTAVGPHYTRDTYKDYQPRVHASVKLEANVGTELARIVYLAGEVLKKFVKLFIIVGFLWLLFSRLGGAIVDDDYRVLMAANLSVMAAALLMPMLSSNYSIMRIYQQLLIILCLPAVAGCYAVLKALGVRLATSVTAALFILYFLLLSSFIPQLMGSGYAHLNLNNQGIYYDNFYTHQSELASIRWLAENGDEDTPVFSDYYARKKLIAFSPGKMDIVDNVLPANITKDGYVYVDYTNSQRGAAYESYRGRELDYRFPLDFLYREKDIIYSNGTTEILK